MATIKPLVEKHYKKADGTYRVRIKITHKGKQAYISTDIYITDKDLNGDMKFKKSFYSKSLNDQVSRYRDYVSDLGLKINHYNDAASLKAYFIKLDNIKGGQFIDFIDFCMKRNAEIEKNKGKNGTYYVNTSALNWLTKFVGESKLNVTEINRRFLEQFEQYMVQKGVGVAGISSYMRALRTLFFAASDEFNDESHDEILIKHNPFRKYKIKEHIPEKRNLEINIIKSIINHKSKFARAELASDMFALTFYLAGIAPIDLYLLNQPANGYVSYYRDKVKNRNNRIKVSIKVLPQTQAILDKYSTNGFLSEIKRYASEKEFSRACAKGLKAICTELQIQQNVTLYWARHTFASVAAELRFDTNLIDYVLGHAPSANKMAEVYISRSQQLVDELLLAVVNRLL